MTKIINYSNSSIKLNSIVYFIYHIGLIIFSILTLGLGLPLSLHISKKFYFKEVYIDGSRCYYHGDLNELYKVFFKWLLYSVISLGICFFFLIGKLNNYINSHVVIENVKDGPYVGRGYRGNIIILCLVKVLNFVIKIFSITILTPWLQRLLQKYQVEHMYFMGYSVVYDCNNTDVYKFYIKQFFLVIFTLGIYIFWFFGNIEKFKMQFIHLDVSQMFVDEEIHEQLENKEEVEIICP